MPRRRADSLARWVDTDRLIRVVHIEAGSSPRRRRAILNPSQPHWEVLRSLGDAPVATHPRVASVGTDGLLASDADAVDAYAVDDGPDDWFMEPYDDSHGDRGCAVIEEYEVAVHPPSRFL
jgi:hypothetical protein